MPYIYWQPSPGGGVASGVVTYYTQDNDGWCLLVQMEDNPQLTFEIREPAATIMINQTTPENRDPVRIQFFYETRGLDCWIFSVRVLELHEVAHRIGLEASESDEDRAT